MTNWFDNITETFDVMMGLKAPRYGVVTNLADLPNEWKKPLVNCYKCKHRGNVAGSCHSSCNNKTCNVGAESHGIKNGWFMFPVDFDPTWLTSCNGFEKNDD